MEDIESFLIRGCVESLNIDYKRKSVTILGKNIWSDYRLVG